MRTESGGQPPVLDVSVIIPTVGRPAQLRTTLESLAGCRPRAAEIIVIDQSTGDAVATTVEQFAAVGAVCIPSSGRGIGVAVNEGLRRVRSEVVLATHDDCSVGEEWIAVGHQLASAASSCIFTGRVLPSGDPEAVPSIKDDPWPQDFSGEVRCDVLFPSNMVLPRLEVLELGGFDERFETAAEDNDFCYRWLKAGRCLRYEPSLVVWHRDWRTREELRQVHVRYWREQGRFYAKHLRGGDANVVRFLLTDAKHALAILRELLFAAIKGRRPVLPDEARGLFRGFVPGLVTGWRDFRGDGSSGR